MNDLEKKGYIFGSMFVISNKLQVLGDKIDPNLTIKQWLFIAAIVKSKYNYMTITEISDFIGYSRQSVKKMSISLEKLGFLEIVNDESDKRVVRIKITEKCKNYLENRAGVELDFISKLFEGFDYEAIENFYKSFKMFENNIIKMENENER